LCGKEVIGERSGKVKLGLSMLRKQQRGVELATGWMRSGGWGGECGGFGGGARIRILPAKRGGIHDNEKKKGGKK